MRVVTELSIAPGSSRMFRIVLTVGKGPDDVTMLARSAAVDVATFDKSWGEAHSKWEARWQTAFSASDGYFTGSMPTLELDGSAKTALRTRFL